VGPTRLHQIRRKYTCIGCLTPIDEFISLRAYGRKITPSDGPAFRVFWGEDGETVSFEGGSLRMEKFRALGYYLLNQAKALCSELMYQWQPPVDLNKVHDDLSNQRQGFSFVHHPANGLTDAYLQLSTRAYMASKDGLLHKERWISRAVSRYFTQCDQFLRLLMCLCFCLSG
jgi:hypothetical protein